MPSSIHAQTPAEHHRLRILLVDANPAERNQAALGLGKHHEVLLASDAQTALALLGQERVDVVCTTFALPGINGIELLHEIRQRCPAGGVLLATFQEYMARGRRAETEQYLTLFKPYDPQRLLEIVGRAFAGASEREALSRVKLRYTPPGAQSE